MPANDALQALAGQNPLSLPLAGPHGPGFSPDEYSDALGRLSNSLYGPAMTLGLAGIGGPMEMGARSLLPALMQLLIPNKPDPRVQQSMVLPKKGWKNAGQMLDTFREKLLTTLGNKPLTPENIAQAFAETRYPGHLKPQEFYPKTYPQPLTVQYEDPLLSSKVSVNKPGLHTGFYNPRTKKFVRDEIVFTTDPEMDSISRDGHEYNMANTVNTLMEEATHGVQARRIPLSAIDADAARPYKDQVFENLAHRGGRTGEVAFNRLLRLISPTTIEDFLGRDK